MNIYVHNLPSYRMHPHAVPFNPLPLPEKPKTPWQKVLTKFGWSRNRMAREMGRDVVVVCRGVNSKYGLIHHNHQLLILRLAKKYGVDLKPSDLLPEV